MAIRQFKTSQGITDRNTLSVNNYLRELNRYSENRTDSIVDQESLHTDLVTLINQSLNSREKEIVIRSFGIDKREQSLEDISEELGLSRERVRRIREKAVVKMKESDNSHLLFKYLG